MSEESKRNLSPQKMIKQAQKTKGYLFKKSGGIFGGWKQLYFIIFNGALSYYNDEALVNLKGQIKIKDIQSIIMKQTDLFMLQTKKKQYEFKCENQQDRDLWVASLNLLKQYISDDDFTKKFLIKHVQLEKKADRFQLCKIEDIRKILLQMKLNLLAQQLDQSRIHQRIYCQKVENSYYISISIKCLELNEVDQQILSQKYVIPYNFNKLYRVYGDGKIQDIAKMSQMQSLKSLDGSVVITFADKKKTLIPYKNQSEAYQITRKLCRCYEVAREYYNSFKIVLKKNIDRLIDLYDNSKVQFEQQTRNKTNQHLNRFKNNETEPVYVFLSEFRFIKRDLIETQQACKVLSTPRDDIKYSYFRFVHEQIRACLTKTWEFLFAQFQPKNLIALSMQLYQYWLVVNPVVSDPTLLEGCFDLNIFFMGRVGQSIRQKIHSFNAQKVQYIKLKNQPIGNQITTAFYDWLKQVNFCLNETVPMETVFDQFCKFYLKCFDQFFQYLTDISEKWSQISVIIGACNDLSRIKSYFKLNIGSDLCKGIFAQKKFYTSCGNQILKKIKQCQAGLIKRAFIIFFRNIDKKLLAKPFLEIDFSKICYQVLQRLQPYKGKLLQEVQYQMVILSFDEICFFLYTTFINKNVQPIKNLKQHYLKAIQKDLTQIEQFYCNIKTQSYVKKYLKQISVLKEILICPQSGINKYIGDLHHTFGASFTQESISTILKIRQIGEQNFNIILQQCLKGLTKSPSSQDSESYQDSHMRSRKSTLTESLYTISIPQTNRFSNSKVTKEGYLEMKKVVKGIPNFFNRSYFKIKDGHLLEYNCVNSNEILSSIELNYADYCYLDSQAAEKCIFIIMIQSTTYYFKATNRDEAGLWIQAIYSEIKHPLFQHKSQFPQKQKKNAIFKNLQIELTTTASHKRKTGQHLDDEKILEQKRTRRIKQIAEVKKSDSSSKAISQNNQSKGQNSNFKKNSPKKKPKNQIAKQDEGTCCCGNKLF